MLSTRRYSKNNYTSWRFGSFWELLLGFRTIFSLSLRSNCSPQDGLSLLEVCMPAEKATFQNTENSVC